MGSEEIVVGDVEGEMIDPDNDPFALDDPRKPVPARLQQGIAAPQQIFTPRPAPALVPTPRAAPSREWPPRF
jgi:hypothetical protein